MATEQENAPLMNGEPKAEGPGIGGRIMNGLGKGVKEGLIGGVAGLAAGGALGYALQEGLEVLAEKGINNTVDGLSSRNISATEVLAKVNAAEQAEGVSEQTAKLAESVTKSAEKLQNSNKLAGAIAGMAAPNNVQPDLATDAAVLKAKAGYWATKVIDSARLPMLGGGAGAILGGTYGATEGGFRGMIEAERAKNENLGTSKA